MEDGKSATAPLLLSHNSSQNETLNLKQPPPPPMLAFLEETADMDDEWSHKGGILQAVLVSMAWVFDAQQTFITVFTDADPSLSSSSDIINIKSSSSILSEWGLESASSLVRGLPASAFFLGCLVGGALLASLADSSLGRKRMLLLSCWVMSVSSLLTAFSPNLWAYSALRFISGFGRASIGTCALVLSTELVGKRWRAHVGIVGFFCFTLGFLSLPALAYATRGSSWRELYLLTAFPGILYCAVVHVAVRESPRWLRLHDEEGEGRGGGMYSAMRILATKGWAAKRVGAVMGVGFGVGFVYYGMPLGLRGLAFPNLYLSVAFNALSELPASLVTLALVGHLDRKTSLVVFTLVSGALSVLSAVSGGSAYVQIGAEMVSFFSACTAFNVLLIFTVELFPTCVRNSAVSMVRQALVLGGVFSPLLVAAGAHSALLSFGVFGLVIGLCGLFAMCLPETRGKPIWDTMDQEENSDRPVYCV